MSAFAIEADLTTGCLPYYEVVKNFMTPRNFSRFFQLGERGESLSQMSTFVVYVS